MPVPQSCWYAYSQIIEMVSDMPIKAIKENLNLVYEISHSNFNNLLISSSFHSEYKIQNPPIF